MDTNIIVEVMKKLLVEKVKSHLCGKIIFSQGSEGCNLEERGGVYGFAIKLEDNEISGFLEIANEKKDEVKKSQWKPLLKKDDYTKSQNDKYAYYPLYWGSDINLGSRLYSHTTDSQSTGTLQLNKRVYLKDKEVIYGAMFCSDRKNCEEELRKEYPDILKTKRR